MAIVLPVFLGILFSFIEVSRLVFAVNTTQVALIKATRTLSLSSSSADDGQAAAVTYLTSLGYDENDITVTTTPAVITDATNEITMNIQLNMQPLPYVVDRSLTRSRE